MKFVGMLQVPEAPSFFFASETAPFFVVPEVVPFFVALEIPLFLIAPEIPPFFVVPEIGAANYPGSRKESSVIYCKTQRHAV